MLLNSGVGNDSTWFLSNLKNMKMGKEWVQISFCYNHKIFDQTQAPNLPKKMLDTLNYFSFYYIINKSLITLKE